MRVNHIALIVVFLFLNSLVYDKNYLFVFRNDWSAFHPKTNIFWLHYVGDKLIRSKRYKRNSKEDQKEFRRFRNLVKDMLQYSSACDLVTSAEYFLEET